MLLYKGFNELQGEPEETYLFMKRSNFITIMQNAAAFIHRSK